MKYKAIKKPIAKPPRVVKKLSDTLGHDPGASGYDLGVCRDGHAITLDEMVEVKLFSIRCLVDVRSVFGKRKCGETIELVDERNFKEKFILKPI